MNDFSLSPFEALIARQTGLRMRPQDRNKLDDIIRREMMQRNMAFPGMYLKLLEEASRESPVWDALVAKVTVGESYFFRDRKQMALLREQILPELIRRNRAMRSLRIWSAGCSSGEEAYSLAMLVDEVLPDRETWQVSVVGTDIHKDVLKKARQGIYGDWSFREVDGVCKARYFEPANLHWQVRPDIRDRVAFHPLNLVQDALPNIPYGVMDADLILCRNVFIYFHRDVIGSVLDKFAQTLRPGGYLLTGHGELYDQENIPFVARNFPDSTIYQRKDAGRSADVDSQRVRSRRVKRGARPEKRRSKKRLLPASGFPEREVPQEVNVKRLETLVSGSRYVEAVHFAESLIGQSTDPAEVARLAAQSYASLGAYEEARRHCLLAIEADPFNAQAYYLLAQVAEEEQDASEAKACFQKCIYLSPSFAPAYVRLGTILDHEGQEKRAVKFFRTALSLLWPLPADAPLEPFGEATVGHAISLLENRLAGQIGR